jgi:hypothetical protein
MTGGVALRFGEDARVVEDGGARDRRRAIDTEDFHRK